MRALIASSATGGHIYPALAVAEEIKKRDAEAEILFVGAKWEIGKDIVKFAGYRQEFIDVRGFDRKNPFKALAAMGAMLRASGEIKKILRGFKPDICFGTGGHVAGPVIRAARKAGVCTMIQEQNVIPGLANKLAEKYADKVFAGFDAAVQHFKDPGKVIVSGNPVRAGFSGAEERRAGARKNIGVPEDACCVLIFGGSQGADAINDAVIDMAAGFAGQEWQEGCYFIWITGRQLFTGMRERIESLFSEIPAGLAMVDYADEIYDMYAAADLIVSRAGALTVSEIALSSRASILIPSPNVTNNHQYYNAKILADAGAAILVPEGEIHEGGLAAPIRELTAAGPEKLKEMGRKAGLAAKPDAARTIADEIEKLAGQGRSGQR